MCIQDVDGEAKHKAADDWEGFAAEIEELYFRNFTVKEMMEESGGSEEDVRKALRQRFVV